MEPRVSILIPNFNNGCQSSSDGKTDLLGNLLQSLWDTLQSDPTPFEIIAYDDGSTDDSLQTLRNWADKPWPSTSGGCATQGGKFLTLIEAEHGGVLAKNANVLSRRARGEYFARLDGDTICLTEHWVTRLCEVFDNGPPRLGVVGPKQLRLDGRIHAFGDWVIHPNGYTHIAAGMERYAVQTPMEVDHVMGCFYCHKRAVYEELNGYDESILRGQTIDFGLRARLHGWSCIAVPHIEFIHAHGQRSARKTEADSAAGVRQALDAFEKKWGFSRLAPDMDEIRRRYAGTPLLWNARFFGAGGDGFPHEAPPDLEQPVKIERTDWVRYTKDANFKNAVDLRVALTLDVVRQAGRPQQVALVGAGPGLIAHLIAARGGLPVIATERHAAWVKFAQTCVANQKYPATAGGPNSSNASGNAPGGNSSGGGGASSGGGTSGGGGPRYVHQSHPRRLPLDDGQVDLLLIFDQLERHPNPVALLREAHRVLKSDKLLVMVVKRRPAQELPATDPLHPFTMQQLVMLLQAAGGWSLLSDPSRDDPSRDIILVVKRSGEAPPKSSHAAAQRAPTPQTVGSAC